MKVLIKTWAISLSIFLILLIFASCEKNKESITLQLIDSYKLEIPEPSGLAFSYDKTHLYCVSDYNGKIYKLDFNGRIVDEIETEATDLEGITSIDDSTLAVVCEKSGEIITISSYGRIINNFQIESFANKNSGLEGLTYSPKNNSFYTINEKDPGLMLKVNMKGKVEQKNELNFASDYSAIFFDEKANQFWILSDEDKKLFLVDFKGDVLGKYRLEIVQPEGLAIDFDNRKVFIISDKKERLYIYQLPNL